MANNKLSILKFSETAYDIDALYLGGVAADKFARRDTENSFTGKNTFSAGVQISGRFLGSGDDEGLVIGKAVNNYAGVCLGDPSGVRSVFYLKPDDSALWRYNNGTSVFDIYHPSKAGTIALTSDIPTKVSKLENDSGYGTVAKVDNISPTSGNVSLSAVRFVSQTLTDAQKTQARTNIGAASSTHTHPTFFGYSQSESNANTKICAIENFSLSEGVRVLINFSHTNTAANPYLNISSTGSKPIKYLDSSAAAGSLLQAGR